MTLETKPPEVSAGPDLVCDCRLMLRYARKNAFDLSPELVSDITRLDSILKQRGFDPISDVNVALVAADQPAEMSPPGGAPAALVGTGDAATQTAAPAPNAEELVLRVHGELSKVITPTTALTLQASEPPPGKHRFLGGMPLIVKSAALMAVISAVLFVASAEGIADKAANAKKAAAGANAAVQAQPAPSAPAASDIGGKP